MQEILYISYFNKNNYYDYLGIYNQISMQSNNLLALFENEKLYQHYNSLYMSKQKLYKKVLADIDTSFFDIVKNYINQYKYFIFIINTKLFIKNDIKDMISTLNGLSCININNDIILIVTKNIDLIEKKEKLSYSSLLNKQFVCENYIKNFDKYISIYEDIHDNTSDDKKNITFYEDDLCLFAIFDSKYHCGLVSSPVYMNKKNQKIYNVHNNCVGNVLEYIDKTAITINWFIDNSYRQCTYKKIGQIFV